VRSGKKKKKSELGGTDKGRGFKGKIGIKEIGWADKGERDGEKENSIICTKKHNRV
jgi:hypothetical protein